MGAFGINGTENQALGWDYAHISGTGTFVIATQGPIVLHCVNVNNAGTLCTIYDASDSSSLTSNNTVAAIATVVQRATNLYDLRMNNGIVIVTTGSGTDITVSFGSVLP